MASPMLFFDCDLVYEELVVARFDNIIVIAELFYICGHFKLVAWYVRINKYLLKTFDCISSFDAAVFVKDTIFNFFGRSGKECHLSGIVRRLEREIG